MSQELRSSFLINASTLNEEFYDHFTSIWSLDAGTLENLPELIVSLVNSKTVGEERIKRVEFIEKSSSDRKKLSEAISSLKFIYSQWNPIHDDIKTFKEDIVSVGLFDPKDRDKEKFIDRFLQIVEQQNYSRLERATSHSYLPLLDGVSSSVEFRAIFRKRHIHAMGAVDDYEPECIGFVPIGLLIFERSGDEPTQFLVQVTRGRLRRLLDDLKALEKEMESSESSLRGLSNA